MSHHHLKLYERQRLVKFIKQGYSQRKIVELLGFSQSSVSKEIKRNSNYKKIPSRC